MVWTFEDAEKYLEDTAPPGKSKYGLGRINHLLDLLGHPENEFSKVTVVGTNGKGSTIAFLDSLLLAHGIKTACHIKPHLEEVTERIRINGVDSSRVEFASALWEVNSAIESGWSRDDRATYFELIFAAFLCAARSSNVEITLLEAGLGGRLDAVNSVDADLVVLTSIGFDHTDLLGETLEEITREKVAVVRPGSILVIQENPQEVREVTEQLDIRNRIEVRHNRVSKISLDLGLTGPFQQKNASLALLALDVIKTKILPDRFPDGLVDKRVKSGLKSARLPGRWEIFRGEGGVTWIIDGAHNEPGLEGVFERFRHETGGNGTVIFGLKKTKVVEDIVPHLVKSAGRIIFVSLSYFESWEPDYLAEVTGRVAEKEKGLSQVQVDCADSIEEGIEIAGTNLTDGGSVLITGSLYLAGDARKILGKIIPGVIPGHGVGV